MKCYIRLLGIFSLTSIIAMSFTHIKMPKVFPVASGSEYFPIRILFPKNMQKEARWIMGIITENGIPADFIYLQSNEQICPNISSTALLTLCLDQNKTLQVQKFKKESFFAELGPFLKKEQRDGEL